MLPANVMKQASWLLSVGGSVLNCIAVKFVHVLKPLHSDVKGSGGASYAAPSVPNLLHDFHGFPYDWLLHNGKDTAAAA